MFGSQLWSKQKYLFKEPIGWFVMKDAFTCVHGPQRMSPADFGDPPGRPLVQPAFFIELSQQLLVTLT